MYFGHHDLVLCTLPVQCCSDQQLSIKCYRLVILIQSLILLTIIIMQGIFLVLLPALPDNLCPGDTSSTYTCVTDTWRLAWTFGK